MFQARGYNVRGRGTWRGSGRGGTRQRGTGRDEEAKEAPKGALIKVIARSDIKPDPESPRPTLGISNCEYIASYNWCEKEKASILVPGQSTCLKALGGWNPFYVIL